MLFSIVVLLVSLMVFENNVLPAATANPPAIVFQEKVTWFNLDSPTEAFLIIYENEDAAKVTREFYSRYAINEDALFSLLDVVCVGQKLCHENDIIFDETITLSDEKKENRLVLLERLQENGHKRLEWEKISGNDNALQKLPSHSMPVVPSNIASSFNKRSSH